MRPILELMAIADLKWKAFKAVWHAEYDREYQRTVVEPSMGMRTSKLKRNGLFSGFPARSNSRDFDPGRFDLHTESIAATGDREWVVARPGPDGILYRGFDGVRLWHRTGSTSNPEYSRPKSTDSLGTEPNTEFNSPDQSHWSSYISPEFRIMLEPRILLAMMEINEISESSHHTCKIRAKPRNLDLMSSSILSPWAQSWDLVVDANTGVITEATSMLEDGAAVVRHKITELQLNPELPNSYSWADRYRLT